MKLYITAGHDISNKVGNGALYLIYEDIRSQSGHQLCAGDMINEAKLTIWVRDRLKNYINSKKPTLEILTDSNETKLQKVINWLVSSKTGQDVSVEIHFNASVSKKAQGVEVYVRDKYAFKAMTLGLFITKSIKNKVGFLDRGVKYANEGQHSTLPILTKPKGINILIEMCFLDNIEDQKRYFENELTMVEVIGDEILKLF